jgi:hypothetical protein
VFGEAAQKFGHGRVRSCGVQTVFAALAQHGLEDSLNLIRRVSRRWESFADELSQAAAYGTPIPGCLVNGEAPFSEQSIERVG